MKTITTFLFAFILCVNAVVSQTPVITMTTTKAIGSVFTFRLSGNTSKTPVQVDFGDGNLVNDTIKNYPSTTVSDTLVGSQTVKIYGTGIIFLDCSFDQIDSLDVTKNTELIDIWCQHNTLSNLDVTKNTALTYLYCSDNKFTTLDISNNIALTYINCEASGLSILDVTKNTALSDIRCGNNNLTTLDVSKNIALTSLNCSYAQLTTLDISKNISLSMLYCNNNPLTTLDVSKDTALTLLNCANTQLTTLDLSKNIALTQLFCNDDQLTALDISKDTALTFLDCIFNKLTTLDISKNIVLQVFQCTSNQLTALNLTKNTALTGLYCGDNQLTGLDISKDTALTTIICSGNQLTTLDVSMNKKLNQIWCGNNLLNFATLPLKQAAWTIYYYDSQKPVPIVSALNTGITLDLSSQFTVNGNTTAYTWKTKSGTTLSEGTDYTISNGKTIFLKAQTDSVYCEMTNTTFPDLAGTNVLKTTYTKITINTKIEEKEIKEIEIYSHYKTIYINTPNDAKLSIFDINGRMVVSKSINSGTSMIQLQNRSIYLVKLNSNKVSTIRKVLIE